MSVDGRALREPEVGAVRHVEIARRDAGDRRVELGEVDRLADDRRVAVVELLPERVEITTVGGGPGGGGALGGGGGNGVKSSCVKPPIVIGRPNTSKKPSVTP